jgi:hypothetical protein
MEHGRAHQQHGRHRRGHEDEQEDQQFVSRFM